MIRSCARHESVYETMKKMFFGFTVVMTVTAAVTTFATAVNDLSAGQEFLCLASQLTSQGTHCNGTVGCGCPGFSPITNGDVWQQGYCKHCGHKKSSHK